MSTFSVKSIPAIASLLSDAHALPTHWVYDTASIASKLPAEQLKKTLFAPTLTNYHKGKKAGDFTHYGDQTLILLNSLDAKQPFDVTKFKSDWTKEMSGGYKGYLYR